MGNFGSGKCECGLYVPLTEKLLTDYFISDDYECMVCNNKLWDVLASPFREPELILGWHYGILGCLEGRKRIELESNGEYTWDFSEDIDDGKLLGLWLFSFESDKIQPLIIHGNVLQHPLKSNKISIYGRSLDSSSKSIKLELKYVYAPKEVLDDLGIMLLLDAFRFFQEKNYRYMIISAHTSVEIILNEFIENSLIDNGVSRGKAENLLSQAATYSHQLKALLPFVTQIRGLPKLNKRIYDSLEHLRKDRNALIHEGEVDMGNFERLRDELISAFLAHQYFRIYK